jgi:hypothetical protein
MRERIADRCSEGALCLCDVHAIAIEAVNAWEAAEARITALEAGLREALAYIDAKDGIQSLDTVERLRALLAATPADVQRGYVTEADGNVRSETDAEFRARIKTPADAAAYSAPFVPTYDEAHNDLELSRCAKAGATERATINALAEALREVRASFARHMATDVRPTVVTPADAAAELAGLRACFEAHAPRCDRCHAYATVNMPASNRSYGGPRCDAHAPPEATPLPWAAVVRGAP